MRRWLWLLLLIAAGPLAAAPLSAQLWNLARYGTVRQFESPFNGTVCSATPPVQGVQMTAVNYDCGGAEIAFHVASQNPACPVTTYRPDFANIQASQDGVPYQIGCTVVGNWYQYIFTVPSPSPCPCVVVQRTGSPTAGGSWSIAVDGITVASVATPVTGSYFAFTPATSTTFNVGPGTHTMRLTAATPDGAGNAGPYSVFTIAVAGGTCVNGGANLCFLLGSFGPDNGAPSWMGRPWDYTDAFIGQNQCSQISTGFPFDGGADNPGVIGSYQTLIANNAACPNRIYSYKTQNEWWLNCNETNPWQTNQPPIGNGNCTPESSPPTTTPATYISNTCTMINAIRAAYPGIKVSWYGPSNSTEAQFDPSGSCQIDAYEIHIYIFGDNIAGRTGMGDWNGGTPYSCGPAGGPNGTLPHDIQCTAATALTFLPQWAAQHGNKPIVATEVCSGYNDTAGPGGVDYATWAISHWALANNVVSMQWWSGDPDGTGKSNCSFRSGGTDFLNKEAAINQVLGGTHYAGTYYTYIPLPVPYPYP